MFNRWKHTRAEYSPTNSAEYRSAGETDWKCLFANRHRLDRQILRDLRDIVHESRGRFRRMERLADTHGPDALDVLWQIMDASAEVSPSFTLYLLTVLRIGVNCHF